MAPKVSPETREGLLIVAMIVLFVILLIAINGALAVVLS